MVEQYGDSFSYNNCPRAKIFARNVSMIQSFSDFKNLLRYNNFENDPLSGGEPDGAISARMDLSSDQSSAFGGIDSKATNLASVAYMNCDANSGPTHDQQKPFSWDIFPNATYQGQPTVWDFDWVTMHSRFPQESNTSGGH
jgi:hypothetical protein